jgi:hypothetical protein
MADTCLRRSPWMHVGKIHRVWKFYSDLEVEGRTGFRMHFANEVRIWVGPARASWDSHTFVMGDLNIRQHQDPADIVLSSFFLRRHIVNWWLWEKYLKKVFWGYVLWHTPVIPATPEAGIRRIVCFYYKNFLFGYIPCMGGFMLTILKRLILYAG